MTMIQLTIKNRYGFLVSTMHATERSAEIQRRLTAGEPIQIQPVIARAAAPNACERRRKPKAQRGSK